MQDPPVSAQKKAYEARFEQELMRLNAAQAEAVAQIEGPVLVVAGPGTGKTHILSARIGRILRDTDAQAANILCLTFTDAGVQAMRDRLLQLIGPEARRVHIYTFHSFCNGIIQDNLQHFGRADLEPVSELERVELIRRLLDRLPADHALRRGRPDIYFYEKHLQDLFQRFKAENWTVEQVQAAVQTYLDELPNRPEYRYKVNRGEFRVGDLKEGQYQRERERMERLLAAARLFPGYEAALARARRYDYDDMLLWVLKAFRADPFLLRIYQEQYLYVLVDEYQDTNGAQNELLRLLTDYWEQPNIFIVGDDDQSIYEFQGARLRGLLDFYAKYEADLKVVLLRDNYRSSQVILDAARLLIDQNEKRITRHLAHLNIEKHLLAVHEATATVPNVREYPNRAQEAWAIVQQLRDWQAAGIPLSDMAILYARHRQASRLLELLDKQGIPYQTRRRVNILDLPQVRRLREILDYFRAEQAQPYGGEPILFRLLHFRHFGITPADLTQIAAYRAGFKYEEQPTLRQLLLDEGALRQMQLQNPTALRQIGLLLDELLQAVHEVPLPTFVEKVINRTGMLTHALQNDDRLWQVQVLRAFLDFVKKETDRQPRLQLAQLLDTFERMDQNRLSLALHKNLELADGVHLVTAHSAKGLEFRAVWIMDAVSDYWEPGRSGGIRRFSFPDTLTLSGEEDALEARRRLFYVALTRAREQVVVSYAARKTDGKALRRAIFIEELLASQTVDFTEATVDVDPLLLEQLQLTETTSVHVPALERERVDKLLTDFRMSISSLNRYLRCPLSFFYLHVLRAPSVQSEAASYGAAMHDALQRYFDQMLAQESRDFADERSLLRFFEQEMIRLRGYFTPTRFRQRLEQGRRYLADYYQTHRSNWTTNTRTELLVRNVEFRGVPLIGMIDRLDFGKENTVHIIDYKTGSQTDQKLRPPTKTYPHGGTYWRQLVFYKILYESQLTHTHTVRTGRISYLEPATDGSYNDKTVNYTPEAVQLVQHLIVSTYDKIKAHDFYEGCGEDSCVWCRFVQDNIAIDTLSERTVEELDDRLL